jgi:spore maturation protein CgeB
MRVVVTSGTVDAVNTNHRLRHRIAHGFRELGLRCQAWACERLPELLGVQRVDLLLITGSIADSSVDLAWLVDKARGQGAEVVFWMHDDPYEFDLHWQLQDLGCLIFTNEPNCVDYYSSQYPVRPLALAASPLDDLPAFDSCIEPQVDLGFCGVAFPQRIAIIRQLQKAGFSVECWGDLWPNNLIGCLNQRLGPVGLRGLYRRCRFVLNLGRDVSIANRRYQVPASMPGPRTFEAALLGAVQLYLGQSPRIRHYYQPEQGVIEVNTEEEIRQLVARSYDQPHWLHQLGVAAADHTRRHHLYRHRCHDLLSIVQAERKG